MMPGCSTHDTQERTSSPAFYEERIRLLTEEFDRLRDAAREVLDYENQPSRRALSRLREVLG